MIFATVGTQLPFDRLLTALDRWAVHNPDIPILAQSGATDRHYRHIETIPHLGQSEFNEHFRAARLVVAHAGMGSILSAAEMGKPIILMPRRAQFQEHRNDHQMDTAKEMARLSNVAVVQDGEALHQALDHALSQPSTASQLPAPSQACERDPLISAVRDFVWSGFDLSVPTTTHGKEAG